MCALILYIMLTLKLWTWRWWHTVRPGSSSSGAGKHGSWWRNNFPKQKALFSVLNSRIPIQTISWDLFSLLSSYVSIFSQFCWTCVLHIFFQALSTRWSLTVQGYILPTSRTRIEKKILLIISKNNPITISSESQVLAWLYAHPEVTSFYAWEKGLQFFKLVKSESHSYCESLRWIQYRNQIKWLPLWKEPHPDAKKKKIKNKNNDVIKRRMYCLTGATVSWASFHALVRFLVRAHALVYQLHPR